MSVTSGSTSASSAHKLNVVLQVKEMQEAEPGNGDLLDRIEVGGWSRSRRRGVEWSRSRR